MPQGQFGLVLRQVRRLLGARPETAHTDRELLRRFARQRDETAFATLVDRHGPMVLSVCRRVLDDAHDADDAFQATFLVLARRAASPGWEDSIGNWLYGVAHRTALKARARGLRRQAHETQGADMEPRGGDDRRLSCPAETDPQVEAARREFRSVLDEELARLPDKYRAPLVLCYLEGKTNEEAARELGWPAGSMSRHLTRGRDLLRERLTSRGVAFSTGLFTTVLAESAAPASVPAGLAVAAVRLAAVGASGQAGAPELVTLAEGVLKAMFLHKLKMAAAILVAVVGLGLGAGSVWHQLQAADAKAAEKPNKPKPEEKKETADPAPKAPEVKGLTPAALAREYRRRLAQQVNLPNGIPANTPLKEALELLSEKCDVTLIIDSKAFEGIGVQKVEEQNVTLPKIAGVSLNTVLRLLLGQVRGDKHYGTFRIRGDYIEVTTTYDVAVQVLGPEAAQADENQTLPELLRSESFHVTSVDIRKQPLQDALRKLADEESVNIVLDPRVGDKAKTEVSATMDDVLVGTALRLLADMADLKVVTVNNVYYVTTKPNAEAMEAEQAKRRPRAPAKPEKPTEK
jgi:RNA polymerase sigma factor (sigma-70 family)